MSNLITVRQAAEWSGIDYDVLRNAAYAGYLRCTRRGRRVFVTREDVLDYSHRRQLSDDLFDAEWQHFTQVCSMGYDDALDVLAFRYGVKRQSLERRLLRRRHREVAA